MKCFVKNQTLISRVATETPVPNRLRAEKRKQRVSWRIRQCTRCRLGFELKLDGGPPKVASRVRHHTFKDIKAGGRAETVIEARTLTGEVPNETISSEWKIVCVITHLIEYFGLSKGGN